MSHPIKFYEMFNLMGRAVRDDPSSDVPLIYSQELLVAICFEETAFENMKQRFGAGNAVGFGQVEPALVNANFGLTGTDAYKDPRAAAAAILADDYLSTAAVVKHILRLHKDNGRKKQTALLHYAGGNKPGKRSNAVVNAWLAAEASLQNISVIAQNLFISEQQAQAEKVAIKAALKKTARRDEGFFKYTF